MANKTIWSELWARALREPMGLYLRFANGHTARAQLQNNRPPEAHGYTVARTEDPSILLICGPTVNPKSHQTDGLRKILADITVPIDTPDDDTEPLL